jgi:penicillin amidase
LLITTTSILAHSNTRCGCQRYVDTQDLFVERFRERPSSHEGGGGDGGGGGGGRDVLCADGEWRAAQVLNEELKVRGVAKPIPLRVTITQHGPVICGDPSKGWGIAICDPGLIEATPWVDAALAAMKSTSVSSLHDSLAEWTDRVNNYAVADIDGHFGYLHEGRVPVRDAGNGWGAVAGWTGEHDWKQGTIPREDLPRCVDPDVGWAVTCNQRVADATYPYYVGLHAAPDHRARRVVDRIQAIPIATATALDMEGIHGDRISLPAGVFVRRLLAALAGTDTPPGVQLAAVERLNGWEGDMDRNAVAPLMYVLPSLHHRPTQRGWP